MEHSNNHQRVLRRLKILEGQIRGVGRMVKEGKYCIEILHQTLAAKQALSGIEALLLEHHLATHVIEQMKGGKEKKAIREILDIYLFSKPR